MHRTFKDVNITEQIAFNVLTVYIVLSGPHVDIVGHSIITGNSRTLFQWNPQLVEHNKISIPPTKIWDVF